MSYIIYSAVAPAGNYFYPQVTTYSGSPKAPAPGSAPAPAPAPAPLVLPHANITYLGANTVFYASPAPVSIPVPVVPLQQPVAAAPMMAFFSPPAPPASSAVPTLHLAP
ncbi:hypothetical protein VTK56DRAFT_9828 [Thermocarpiscus australiensis]